LSLEDRLLAEAALNPRKMDPNGNYNQTNYNQKPSKISFQSSTPVYKEPPETLPTNLSDNLSKTITPTTTEIGAYHTQKLSINSDTPVRPRNRDKYNRRRSTVASIRASVEKFKENYGSSSFNLMNAILGSGILGLPYVMNLFGYGLFAVMLSIVAFLALFAVDSLLHCCNATGLDSYEMLAERAFGIKTKVYTCIILWFHSYTAMVSYMTIVKNELPEVLLTIFRFTSNDCNINENTWWTDGNILFTIVLIGFVMPLSSFRKIDFLSFTSAIGMFCMICFSAIIVYHKFIITCPFEKDLSSKDDEFCDFSNFTSKNSHEFSQFNEELKKDNICEVKPLQLTWSLDHVMAIPIMLFSFMCHASVLPIYAECKPRTRKFMLKVTKTALLFCFLVYLAVGVMGYLTFRSATIVSDVLLMYTNILPLSTPIMIARICSLVCVIFSAPLLHFPCRKALKMLLFPDKPFSWSIHLSIMLFNLILVFVNVYGLGQSLGNLLSYGGIIAGNSLILILPNLFYLKLCSVETLSQAGTQEKLLLNGETVEIKLVGVHYDQRRRSSAILPEHRSETRKVISKIIIVVGVVNFMVSISLQIYKDFFDHSEKQENH